MDSVFQWVSTYGYAGIFLLLMLGVVGLPIPEETLLVFCGYLVSQGKLHPLGAWFSALAGSWCGISVSYTIGRTLGLGVVHRFGKYLHITEERLNIIHAWFDRIGHWALFVGYWVVGVRHFTAIVAGTSRLGFPSFMTYAWSGGLLWVSPFVTLGYFLGENWRRIAWLIHQYAVYVSVVLIAAILIYYLLRGRVKRTA